MTPQSLHRHTPPRDGRVSTRRVFSPRREEELARKRREWMRRQEALKRHNLLQRLCAEQYEREIRRLEEHEHRRRHRRRSSRSRSRSRDRTIRFRTRSREPRLPTSREFDHLASHSHQSTVYQVHMPSPPRRPEERSQYSRQGREPRYRSNPSHRDVGDPYRHRGRSEPESNRTHADPRYSRRFVEDPRLGSSRTRSPLPPDGICRCGSHFHLCTCPLGDERRRRESTGRSRGRYEQESGDRNRTTPRNQDRNQGNRRRGDQQEVEPSRSTSQQRSAQFQALQPQNPDVAHQPLQQQQPGVMVNPPQQQSVQQLPVHPTSSSNRLILDPKKMVKILIAQQILYTEFGSEFYNWHNNREKDPRQCPVPLPFQTQNWDWNQYLLSRNPLLESNGDDLINLGSNTFWQPVPPLEFRTLYPNKAERGRGRGHPFGRGRGRGYPRGRGGGLGY